MVDGSAVEVVGCAVDGDPAEPTACVGVLSGPGSRTVEPTATTDTTTAVAAMVTGRDSRHSDR
ncbi:hypothetical protein D1871_18550 [Nakamurella silvestris]|nr:hypothetical protein D1871_18550 [Nakamurella silvestris]